MIESITPAPGIHPWGANGAPMEQKAPSQAPSPWELPWSRLHLQKSPPSIDPSPGESGPLPQAI